LEEAYQSAPQSNSCRGNTLLGMPPESGQGSGALRRYQALFHKVESNLPAKQPGTQTQQDEEIEQANRDGTRLRSKVQWSLWQSALLSMIHCSWVSSLTT
jgi:hypothetical protein